MRRSTLNFLVDLVLLLVMLSMAATGLVMALVLPPGTGGRHGHGAGHETGRGLVLWGAGRHDWGDLHFWLAVTLCVLLIVHIVLHWTWVCETIRRLLGAEGAAATKSDPRKRTLYGLGFLGLVIVFFIGFLWLASAKVIEVMPAGSEAEYLPTSREADWDPGHADYGGDEEHETGGAAIRGSMTLAEVESATGVPVSVIRSRLGLPETVSADERLGRLKRQYGFEMSTIREIVENYQRTTKE